jgi:hypothetical protein
MHVVDNVGIVVMPPATVATNASNTVSFDTKGFHDLNLYIGMAAHTTSLAALATMKLSEGDTTSSYTDIVAFTGGTATSTSAGFVIPTAANHGVGEISEFQVDLRKRKRYLKLTLTPGDTTANETYAIGILSRPSINKDDANSAQASTKKHVTNLAATNITSVAMVVKG